jgi:hypothetical protein
MTTKRITKQADKIAAAHQCEIITGAHGAVVLQVLCC